MSTSKFVVAIAALLCGSVQAGDLLLGQRTVHMHEFIDYKGCTHNSRVCDRYNDSQELIGYAGEKYAVIYMHQNSMRERSIVVTRNYKYDLTRHVRPYVAVGLATGYEQLEYAGKVAAMGYFGVDLHPADDRLGVLVTWQPEAFVGVGVRFKIN